LFALASDVSESDAIDVDKALFNLDSDFGSSRILNDFDEDEINNPLPTSNRRTSAEENSAVSTSSEEDRFIESIEHLNARRHTHPMTITLSSDDESDSNPGRPSTSSAKERTRMPNSKSTRHAKTATNKHTKTPVPAKTKRKSPPSRKVQKNKRVTAPTGSSASLESSLRKREDELDVELVSNSVGDITLDRIQQLEADELLARELQSVYDNEDYHR
uniref:Uncharacterized protein n=1 Tax=Romanomermis culicivorax TaxID=13658 RepID=A0A915HRL1_ROMCU